MGKSLLAGTEKRRGGYLFLGLVLGSLGIGCGMFDIRAPTPPPKPGSGPPHASPVAPESVLFNFEQAIRYQTNGLDQFDKTLFDTFHLVLDQADVADIGIPGIDSLSKTRTYDAQQLRSGECPKTGTCPADSFYFAFGNATPTKEGQTAYYLDIPYELRILVRQGDTLAVTQTIKGTSDLYLALQANTWSITRWVDQREFPLTSLGRWYAEKVGTGQAPRIP
jgi:hypothetical protein